MGSTIGGILLTFIGGIFGGLFTAPMRGCKGWEWENSWFVYSLYGMVGWVGSVGSFESIWMNEL